MEAAYGRIGLLSDAFHKGGPEGATTRLMRGEITFLQWVPLMEENCRKCFETSGISLPENFSVNEIFGKAISARKINHPMLQAALTLRKKGFTTAILTNTWLDDRAERDGLAQLMCKLKTHFDFLIESCQVGMVKPEPQIYKFLLDTLKTSPSEVVFLDDVGANLKPARDLGMVTILVKDTDTALRELEKVTRIQLLNTLAPLPTSCNPSDVSHGYVTIKPGVRLHFVELGSGPAVCLCHGFPESWYSWRYQIPALAQAGYRVLALDMKGYGESSAPHEIEEYCMEVLCKEMVTFLDKLGLSQAVFIGHDWGGILVWYMALFYPERVRAVASLNTPFMPANPNVHPMESIKAIPMFDYQLYFQEPCGTKSNTGSVSVAFLLPVSFLFALSLSLLILRGISQKRFLQMGSGETSCHAQLALPRQWYISMCVWVVKGWEMSHPGEMASSVSLQLQSLGTRCSGRASPPGSPAERLVEPTSLIGDS
ncbi:LOW QUALITY PROTEIN: Bifunctional epoxide hydrolase 2 [Plecturocebus cupreus]